MDHGFTERDGGEEMILKEVKCIHWDVERETKQKDDKGEHVVNGRVDPWLKLIWEVVLRVEGDVIAAVPTAQYEKSLK